MKNVKPWSLFLVVSTAMNSVAHARYYDAATARFISPDTVVQAPDNPQTLNRYSYVGNNPLNRVDPDGHAFFVPLLVAAAIGAGASAATYSAVSLSSGNGWDFRHFTEAAAAGAIAGAVSGGVGGALTSAFGQNLAFGVLSNMVGMSAVTVAQGGNVTGASLAGAFVGGLAAGAIPGFQGVQGGALKNIGAELAYGSVRGAVEGTVSGGVTAGIEGGDIGRGAIAGAQVGAISGGMASGIQIAAFGNAILPDNVSARSLADLNGANGGFGRYGPVYRSGGLASLVYGRDTAGVAYGRNLVIDPQSRTPNTFVHETYHYYQMAEKGYGNVLTTGIHEQAVMPLIGMDPYQTPRTQEFEATIMANIYAPY